MGDAARVRDAGREAARTLLRHWSRRLGRPARGGDGDDDEERRRSCAALVWVVVTCLDSRNGYGTSKAAFILHFRCHWKECTALDAPQPSPYACRGTTCARERCDALKRADEVVVEPEVARTERQTKVTRREVNEVAVAQLGEQLDEVLPRVVVGVAVSSCAWRVPTPRKHDPAAIGCVQVADEHGLKLVGHVLADFE